MACCTLLAAAGLQRVFAATITNYLATSWWQAPVVSLPVWQMARLVIGVGDTVVWVNPSNSSGTATLVSYGGEWQSPAFNPGGSFSLTFTNPAFYAYSIGFLLGPSAWGASAASGTLEVQGWTNGPPAVAINTPPDGSVPPDWQNPLLIQASVPDPSVVPRVEYYAESNVVGTGLSPSYSVWWTNPPVGKHLLVAKAVDQQGGQAFSKPVAIQYGLEAHIWGMHLLSGGQLRVFLQHRPFGEDSPALDGRCVVPHLA